MVQATLLNVADTSFDLLMTITNEGGNDFNARFRIEDASVVDDVGGTYPSGNGAGLTTDVIGPNQSRNYTLPFRGTLNPSAKELTLVLTQLSGLSNLRMGIPLGRDTANVRLEASLVNIGLALI